MPTAPTKLSLHLPATYRICVQGALNENWSDYFSGLTLVSDSNAAPAGVTILTGQLTDQAALVGLLNRLYGLGLPLISVEWLTVC